MIGHRVAWDRTPAWGNVSAPVSSNDPLESLVSADAYSPDGGFAPSDDGFAQAFRAPRALPSLRSIQEREDREFRKHRRRSRSRQVREVAGEVADALSLGILPLYRKMEREWQDDDGEYFMGLRQESGMFRRGVQAIKRLVNGTEASIAPPAAERSLELIADHEVPEGLVQRVMSDRYGSESVSPSRAAYAASYDPQAIGEAYVSSTLRGRTLNKSAMRAVEAKRDRLERFAHMYAHTGSVERAAEAVGITTDRTIADYVRRTGVPEGSDGSENRSDGGPFDAAHDTEPQNNYE